MELFGLLIIWVITVILVALGQQKKQVTIMVFYLEK